MDGIQPAAPRLTFSGLASGLDTGAIVEALIDFERRPLTLLEGRRSDLEAQQGLIRSLGTMLLDLRTAAQDIDNLTDTLTGPSDSEELLAFTATSSNDATLEAEAGDDAVAGTYVLDNVVVATGARRVSTSFADADAALSATDASFTVDYGGGQIALTVTAGTTLNELADAINDDAANDGTVQAAVLFDGTGYRLTLAGTQTGSSNNVTVTTDLSGGAFVEFGEDADDASFDYLGVSVTRESNDVTDLIPGVTVRLRASAPATSTTVTVVRDDTEIAARLQSLADAYNKIRDFSIAQSEVDDTFKLGGMLSGDSFVRQIETTIQRVAGDLYSFTDNPLGSLGQIGLAFDETGRLQLDEEVLTSALDADPLAVRELLSGDGTTDGAAAALARVLEPMVRSGDGTFAQREESFDQRIADFDTQIERFEFRLEKREETLRAQFSRLETLISSLQGQTSFLQTLLPRELGMTDPFASYRQVEITSSSPEVLVLRLYEAALRHCRTARELSDPSQAQQRTGLVSKALAIVSELQTVLDFEQGGEIARELDRLYTFANDRLVASCVTDGAPALDEAIRVLEPLHDGWAGIVHGDREDAA